MQLRRPVIVFGDGKTSRGFLAEVFSPDRFDLTIVGSPHLAEQKKGRLSSTIVKVDDQGTQVFCVEGIRLLSQTDAVAICEQVCRRGAVAAISVSPMLLNDAAATLALAIAQKALLTPDEPLDILLCVNTPRALEIVRDAFESMLGGGALQYARTKVGLVQTVVLRMVSEAAQPSVGQTVGDPEAILTNGYPELPVDGRAFKGEPPNSPMLRLSEHIEAELVRKLFTVSMATTAVAFLGWEQRLTWGLEAIDHPLIGPAVEKALRESAAGLCAEYGLDEAEMAAWNRRIVHMLKIPELSERLDRLGADSARKLGPNDRLVGPATLCVKHGFWPEALCRIIAAGYAFAASEDNGTRRVLQSVRRDGIESALEHYSRIDIKSPLQDAVLAEWDRQEGGKW